MPSSLSPKPTSYATEQEVLTEGIGVLQAALPGSWKVVAADPQGPVRNSVLRATDAVLYVTSPNNQQTRIAVEAKRAFAPRDAETVLGGSAALMRHMAGDVPILVMAPWLSDRSRDLLRARGFNFLDLAGNIGISIDNPGLFIDRRSESRPRPKRLPAAGLKGAQAGRVIRLLADVVPPYGVLAISEAAHVSPGYVSRLLVTLDREALVERGPRGVIESVDWAELLRLRARTYRVFETNSVSQYVCPNGPAWALETARNIGPRGVAVTGSFAAEELVSVAAPSLLILYVAEDPTPLVEAARLLPADAGANVILAKPYDSVVMQRPLSLIEPRLARLPLVACSQVVLDCLSGNGRMPAEGEALLEWMREDESRWRLPSLAAASAN